MSILAAKSRSLLRVEWPFGSRTRKLHAVESSSQPMPYLVAAGPEPSQSWQYPLPEEGVMRIGRFSGNELPVPWDTQISREHAVLKWKDGHVAIRCLDDAKNPIQFHGRSYKKLKVPIGEEFKIGRTLFKVIDSEHDSGIQRMLDDDDGLDGTQTQYALRVADRRVELVSKYSSTLWLSSTEQELAANIVGILAEVIPHADSVAVVECDDISSVEKLRPNVLHWEGRNKKAGLLLSRSMIRAALKRSKTILKIRNDGNNVSILNDETGGGTWMFCSPIKGEPQSDWCISVTGRFGTGTPLPPFLTTDDLNGDVNFTELISQLLEAVRKVRMLEDRFAGIRQFFSPSVMESVANSFHGKSLTPTENETAVLFCDLRGFSRIVEDSADDLQRLLKRVSKALGVMTQNIIGHDGVISDFQGDSALGFWGWPVPLAEGPLPACRAALSIQNVFQRANEGHRNELTGFRAGVGIACGRAIAGKIGSKDQSKVGVFGPVVNQGARLEHMTKLIGVPILIDEATAQCVAENMPASQGRCRRIGLLRPPGMNVAIWVSELLPPENKSGISNKNIVDFEAAVDAFVAGNWYEAGRKLDRLPEDDNATNFLKQYMAETNDQVPSDWDGIVTVASG